MSNWFMHPYFLLLLLLLPLAVIFYWKKANQLHGNLKLNQAQSFSSKTLKSILKPHLFWLKIVGFFFLIIALARPRNVEQSTYVESTEGVDIVLATDISASMLATDLQPNRLEAIKEVASDFIVKRINDRIGLVVYAGESYTRTPITSDKNMILSSLQQLQYSGGVINDGTAIGVGLATAINRIKDSKAKSRVIILLTDGVNNQGNIDPITSAEIAKEYGIKVYTIGVGTNGFANFPVSIDLDGELIMAPQKVEIDEKLLQEIATVTQGKYFRATDNSKLKDIYKEIDQLEKSVVNEEHLLNFDEYFRPFLLIGFILILIEAILQRTFFKSFI